MHFTTRCDFTTRYDEIYYTLRSSLVILTHSCSNFRREGRAGRLQAPVHPRLALRHLPISYEK